MRRGACESVSACGAGGTEHRAEKAPGCAEGMGLLGGMFSEDAVTCDWGEAVCGTGPGKPCVLEGPGGPRAGLEAQGALGRAM